jgi:phosphoglycolate phosphatase-like HAD superfamily hydrolase
MFIFDFDDTLFDTQSHKVLRQKVLLDIGVSEQCFWETYFEVRKTADGFYKNSNASHARQIALRGFDEKKVLDAFNSTTTVEILKSLVIEGAEDLLKYAKSLNVPMVLLSLGDASYQELKVKGVGLEKYFDRMFMVNDTKLHVMKELLSHVHENSVWLINDKIEETFEILKEFPNLKSLLRVSSCIGIEKYKESKIPYFLTLKDIQEYVRLNYSK